MTEDERPKIGAWIAAQQLIAGGQSSNAIRHVESLSERPINHLNFLAFAPEPDAGTGSAAPLKTALWAACAAAARTAAGRCSAPS